MQSVTLPHQRMEKGRFFFFFLHQETHTSLAAQRHQGFLMATLAIYLARFHFVEVI